MGAEETYPIKRRYPTTSWNSGQLHKHSSRNPPLCCHFLYFFLVQHPDALSLSTSLWFDNMAY